MRYPLTIYRALTLLCWCLICSISISGQASSIFGELFTTRSGLSHNGVSTILQDSSGFLWIGTQDGLNKYDGYTFEHFHYEPDTFSLSNNSIRCITEGRGGVLWIGTDNGLNKLDRSRGNLWSDSLPGLESTNPGMGSVIHDVLEDEEGYVWIRTDTRIERLDPASGEFTGYDLFFDSLNPADPQVSYAMARDKDGKIWIGTRDGVHVLDPELGHVIRYDSIGGMTSMDVRTVFIDNGDKIWLGTDKGLYWFDRPGNVFINASASIEELKGVDIYSLELTMKDSIIAGTSGGFLVMDPQMKHVRRVSSFNSEELNTRLTTVYNIFEDGSEILWLGTGRGLVKIDQKARKFDVISNLNPVIEGLSSYMISSICHEENGDLWLGTNGSGLNYVKAGTSRAIVYNSSEFSRQINHDQIHTIHKDREGNIWLGTGNGINVKEPGSQRFYRFCDREPGVSCSLFSGQQVYDIMSDSQNNIWFAASNGVYKYNPVKDKIWSYGHVFYLQEKLELQEVSCILEDVRGWIWMGSSIGLIKFIPGSNEFDVYQAAISIKSSNINSNRVFSLMQDSKDQLWIGTASGLNRYNEENDRFDYFSDPVELSEMGIYSIKEDNDGNLWMSSERGLSYYDPEMGTFVSYGSSEGLQDFEYYPGAGFKNTRGRIYFGGVKGLTSFHPDSIIYNTHIPPLSFTQLEKYNELGGQLKPYSLDHAFQVTEHRGAQIDIGFSALDFTFPERNRYMYRMVRKGQDGLWIHIGEQHHMTFSNLSPGKYTLSIKGSNNDLVYNEQEKSLEIVIPYPFWGKGFFIAIYIVAGVFLLYLGIQIRTRNLRKSNRMLQEKEISAKEISRQREELVLKNKNFTDSINYAKRIQIALLPTRDNFKAILPESFVLFEPKDIVSGDFYWINQHGNKVYVAAVDCTGHGVPGAFVSIIGFELFRKITSSEQGSNPAMILDTLNDNFTEIFSDGEQVYLNDGMDLSLCVIDRKEKSLDFSGAFNPLYLVRNETIIEVKADRFSVGADVHVSTTRKLFKSHKIYLQPDDIIYMFSDGYADQFGGPEGKKFKYRRFRHLLLTIHKLPLEKQHSILEESIKEWSGKMDQVDDILVIGIRPNVT